MDKINTFVGIIPSRYASTRLPGKPLKEICGKPMVYWVYNIAKKCKFLSDVYIATDDNRIVETCKEYNMNYILTGNHETATARVYEAATKLQADYYVCINGDEPLLKTETIEKVISAVVPEENIGFYHAVTNMHNPIEVMDPSNIKVVYGNNNNCMYMTRTPIPFPHASLDYNYNKLVCVTVYSLDALEFFINAPVAKFEQIELLDPFRFLENGKTIRCVPVEEDSLSVDTQKDLELVRNIMSSKLKRNNIK